MKTYSMLSHVLVAHSFSLPCSIPRCGYKIMCSYLLPLMDILVVSTLGAITISAARNRNILVMTQVFISVGYMCSSGIAGHGMDCV